jgi:hypothetical protein
LQIETWVSIGERMSRKEFGQNRKIKIATRGFFDERNDNFACYIRPVVFILFWLRILLSIRTHHVDESQLKSEIQMTTRRLFLAHFLKNLVCRLA